MTVLAVIADTLIVAAIAYVAGIRRARWGDSPRFALAAIAVVTVAALEALR